MYIRHSGIPSKQFLWLLLSKYMPLSKGRMVGIDAGCGEMQNRPYFQTDRYFGIDVYLPNLQHGEKIYPEAEMVHGEIGDVKNLKGDFVLCVQVIGNARFNSESTINTLNCLINMLNQNGDLILNIGKSSLQYEKETKNILENSFAKITEITYGKIIDKELNTYLSYAIAWLLYYIPFLRRYGRKWKVFYVCEGKK